MTYETDLGAGNLIGFYLAFDGVDSRVATHSFGELGISGTFLARMSTPRLDGGERLDRPRSLITPGGFSVDVDADSDVLALFARRGATPFRLTNGPLSRTDSSLSLAVFFGGTLPDGETVLYHGREAVRLGTKSGSTYTSSSRGYQTSERQPIPDNALLYDKPTYWQGRRARLFAVNLQTGAEEVVRTGILRSSPIFANGSYSLDFDDVTREAARPLFQGWFPQRALSVEPNTNDIVVHLEVEDSGAFLAQLSGERHVKVTRGQRVEVYELLTVDQGSAPATVDVASNHLVAEHGEGARLAVAGDDGDIDVQQVCFFVADAARAFLMLALSDTGDGSNSATYDVLPGIRPDDADDGAPRRRMGAALPESWVDVDAWEALEGVGGEVAVYLEEPVDLIEFFSRELAWRLGGYLYPTVEGKLSFRRYDPAVPRASVTALDLDADGIIGVHSVDDESEVVASAVLECNYAPLAREYLRKVEVYWHDVVDARGEGAPAIKRSPRTVWIGGGSPSALVSAPFESEIQVVQAFDRIHARTRQGVHRLRVVFPWQRHLEVLAGTVLSVTSSRHPDQLGSLGFTAKLFEVVAYEPVTETGDVVVEIEEQQEGFYVAPAAYVASWSAGNVEITLDVSGDEAEPLDSTSAAAEAFPSGCFIRVYDASASPPFSVSEVLQVGARSGNVLGTTLPSTVTPAAGDIVALEFSADNGEVNSYGAGIQDHAFMADDGSGGDRDYRIDRGGGDERAAMVLA